MLISFLNGISQLFIKEYINEYEILNDLGEGSFGKVKRVIRYYKETEESEEISKSEYAMKIFNKSVLEH